jgi:small-conductance mechanosensitive channel
METLKIGIKYDENNESMNQLLKEIKAEIEEDNKIPPDHPERKRF